MKKLPILRQSYVRMKGILTNQMKKKKRKKERKKEKQRGL